MERIEAGSRVTMHFCLRLENDFVAEQTYGGEPLEFRLGDGSVLPALEQHLIGLKAGERRTFALSAEESFGAREPERVQMIPRAEFPDDIALAPGLIISFSTPAGDELPGTVLELGDEQVKVDFNHPLAGHNLCFEVEILAVAE